MSAWGTALLVCAATLGPGSFVEVAHTDAGLSVDGRLLDVAVSDVDGLPGNELTLAVWAQDRRRRELRVYHLGAAGRDAEPYLVLPVKADVVAWAWADVRPEAGHELVFLTRSGVWALTPDGGYRDILKLVEAELLYDVADPGELPRWPYVLPDGGRDALLLPQADGYGIWRAGGPGGTYQRAAFFEEDGVTKAAGPSDRRRGRLSISAGGVEFSGDVSGHMAEHPDITLHERDLVSAEARMNAPALLDVDGDGRLDLVRKRSKGLHIHLAGPEGIPAEPTRREEWPEAFGEAKLGLALHDLDGDGDLDVLAQLEAERDGPLESNNDVSLLVLINDGERLLQDQPRQILKFEAAAIRTNVADVNADGLPDLVVSKILGPSLLELTSPEGLKVTRSMLVFFGEGGGRFARRPSIEREDVYDIASLGEAIVTRVLASDLDGDGLADLVDTDLAGNTIVYRLEHESSFFGGDSWSLERNPWRRFEGRADMRTTQVDDFNGDGLGDVLSHHGKHLTLLLSRRTGAGR